MTDEMEPNRSDKQPAEPAPVEKQAQKPPGPFFKKLQVGVLRTILDNEAIRRIAQGSTPGKEEKLKQLITDSQVRSAPGELKVKPDIGPYRRASSCPSVWEEKSGTERVRYCQLCELQVYDLTDQDLEQAKKLVFQREAREDVEFYKRRDGKFLTKDCPIGLRKKRVKFALVSAVCVVAGALVLSYLTAVPASLHSSTDSALTELNKRGVAGPEDAAREAGQRKKELSATAFASPWSSETVQTSTLPSVEAPVLKPSTRPIVFTAPWSPDVAASALQVKPYPFKGTPGKAAQPVVFASPWSDGQPAYSTEQPQAH